MKIIDTRMVQTYHVEFSEEETNVLITLGWFPRAPRRPAMLWLMREQIDEWRWVLDEKIPAPAPVPPA